MGVLTFIVIVLLVAFLYVASIGGLYWTNKPNNQERSKAVDLARGLLIASVIVFGLASIASYFGSTLNNTIITIASLVAMLISAGLTIYAAVVIFNQANSEDDNRYSDNGLTTVVAAMGVLVVLVMTGLSAFDIF